MYTQSIMRSHRTAFILADYNGRIIGPFTPHCIEGNEYIKV